MNIISKAKILIACILITTLTACDASQNAVISDTTESSTATGSSDASSASADSEYSNSATFTTGSAGSVKGTTIVVTLFASDSNYSWDESSFDDQTTKSNINEYLSIAANYIEKIASDYGTTATFITDFQENTDLSYNITVDADLEEADDASDLAVWNAIDNTVDADALMEKYDSDNIVFITAMNTDENSSAITCTRTWYDGMEFPYEFVYLFNIDYQSVNPPAVYAHEILHAFGAPDYYTKDEYYNITESTIEYISSNLSNDIMYTCSDTDTGEYVYDSITNEVSELTAYYVGLTDSSALYEQLNLSGCEH